MITSFSLEAGSLSLYTSRWKSWGMHFGFDPPPPSPPLIFFFVIFCFLSPGLPWRVSGRQRQPRSFSSRGWRYHHHGTFSSVFLRFKFVTVCYRCSVIHVALREAAFITAYMTSCHHGTWNTEYMMNHQHGTLHTYYWYLVTNTVQGMTNHPHRYGMVWYSMLRYGMKQ